MAINGELAHQSSIDITWCSGTLLITAEGETPTAGFEVDIEQSPLRIFPPQYNIVQRRLPGVVAQVITPYKVTRSFPMAEQVPIITVHHAGESMATESTANESTRVPVADCTSELSAYSHSCPPATDGNDVPDIAAVVATGRSVKLNFDEAFADAVAQLPSSGVADGLTRVEVTEIGGLFGGIAGFHELFVKVTAHID